MHGEEAKGWFQGLTASRPAPITKPAWPPQGTKTLREDHLLDQIEKGRFAEVEAYLDALRKQRPVNLDGRDIYVRALRTLGAWAHERGFETWDGILKKWAQTSPRCSHPQFLLGYLHATEGGRLRGTGFARDVTPAGWQGFHRESEHAVQHYTRARELAPEDTLAEVELQDLDIRLGQRDQALQRYMVVERIRPGDYHNLRTRLMALHAKWGGAPGQDLDFARWAVRTYPEKPRIPELLIEAHHEHAHTAKRQGQGSDADHRAYLRQPEVQAEFDWAMEQLLRTLPYSEEPLELAFRVEHAKEWARKEVLCERYAARGFASAMVIYAGRLLQSISVERAQKAHVLLEQAARLHHPAAELMLAATLEYGLGTEADTGRAATLLESLADQGVLDVYTRLGILYRDGGPTGPARDLARAESWLRKAIAAHQQAAKYELAEILLERTGDREAIREAGRLLSDAAAKGSKRAVVMLGRAWETGLAGKKDPAKARSLYARLEADSYARACFQLGATIAKDRNGAVPHRRALPWFRRAAAEGLPSAFGALAKLYTGEKGGIYGVPLQPALAREALGRALLLMVPVKFMAEPMGRLNLAEWGDGWGPHEVRVTWANSMIEAGHPEAALGVAEAFAFGKFGFPKDRPASETWYQKAIDLGVPEAAARRTYARDLAARPEGPPTTNPLDEEVDLALHSLSTEDVTVKILRNGTFAVQHVDQDGPLYCNSEDDIPRFIEIAREAAAQEADRREKQRSRDGPPEAQALFEQAKETWHSGDGAAEDAALDLAERACVSGSDVACAWAATNLFERELPRQGMTGEILLRVRRLASLGGVRGDVECQSLTAKSFVPDVRYWPKRPDAPPPDLQAALPWLSAASKAGDPRAISMLRHYKLEPQENPKLVVPGDTAASSAGDPQTLAVGVLALLLVGGSLRSLTRRG